MGFALAIATIKVTIKPYLPSNGYNPQLSIDS
jgi:hypothetical protein